MRTTEIALGAALVASVGLNAYLLLRGHHGGDTSPRQTDRRGTRAPDAAAEQSRRRPATPAPSKPAAAKTQPARTVPALSSKTRVHFAKQTRDPDWAPRQEEVMRTRLDRLLGERSKAITLECRSSCCQLSDPKKVWPTMTEDTQSSAGFAGWADYMSFRWAPDRGRLVVACFDRTKGTFEPPFPTRGAERRRALKAAGPALKKCAAGLTEPIQVGLSLRIDKQGNVADARLSGEHAGTKVAHCVETAIMTVAKFAPAATSSGISFSVDLEPN